MGKNNSIFSGMSYVCVCLEERWGMAGGNLEAQVVEKRKYKRWSSSEVSFPLCVCVSVCAFYVYVPLCPDSMAD